MTTVLTVVHSCYVVSNLCVLRFAEYFSTPAPISVSARYWGNQSSVEMTAQEDNVGLRATESGVKQFQLWLGGSFVLEGGPRTAGQTLSYGMSRGGAENISRPRKLLATVLEKADPQEAIALLPISSLLYSTN